MKIWRAIQSSVRWILGHFIALSLVSSCLLMLWVFANKIPPTSVEVMAGVKGAYFENIYDAINNCVGLIILNNNKKYEIIELTKVINKMSNEKIVILDYWSSLNQFSIKLNDKIIYKTAGNINLI